MTRRRALSVERFEHSPAVGDAVEIRPDELGLESSLEQLLEIIVFGD
jgi:hypothetical protein